MTLLEKLDRLPPFLVHALARENRKRPPLEELVKRSGIPLRTFTRIARKLSWATVKAGHIDAFCRACNVDLLRQTKDSEYLRKSRNWKHRFSYLNPQQRRTLDRLCLELMKVKQCEIPTRFS